MKPKFIYFDFGNIFVTYDLVFSQTQKDLNLSKEFFNTYDKYDDDAMVGKLKIVDIWEQVCLENDTPKNASYNVIKSWVSDFRIISETHKLTKELSAKYLLGILSNLYIGFWKEIVAQKYTPEVEFASVIISAEVGVMKPDKRIYQIAQDRSGFSGQDILFVDDKPENLVTPQQLGWQTFLFDYKNPQKSVDELSKILL